ncbi:transposase domain-containing protein [Nocardiopsis xinjiangensis]|uniref:transposase domain-containing protein n=1 Tax=Nocardiopsis xinjiangensis TaxID=124285 RepID=UPI001377EE48
MPVVLSTPYESVSGRLTDHLDLGVLVACYPRDVIEDVWAGTGAKEQRARSLPAHFMVRHSVEGVPTGSMLAPRSSGRSMASSGISMAGWGGRRGRCWPGRFRSGGRVRRTWSVRRG